MREDLLSIDSLITYLNETHKDLFDDKSINLLRDTFDKLIVSINDYNREKILKSGTDEEIEAEKQKMNETFEKNVISASHPDYEYDKRISFEMDENEKLENEWDSEDDEIYDDSDHLF